MPKKISKKAKPERTEHNHDLRPEVARAMGGLLELAKNHDSPEAKLADVVFGEDHNCAVSDELRTVAKLVNFFCERPATLRRSLRQKIDKAINEAERQRDQRIEERMKQRARAKAGAA